MRSTLVRPLVVLATVAAGLGVASPAHAETVRITVTVGNTFGADVVATSTHPNETFDNVLLVRAGAVTVPGVPPVSTDAATTSTNGHVAGISGATAGVVTYTIVVTPSGESFPFVSEVDCTKGVTGTGVSCVLPDGVGTGTVITLVTGGN